MKESSGIRALYLYKILYEKTDESHPLTTAELIKLMEAEYGIKVYRTTVASDIEQLTATGADICTVKSTQNKYFIGSRLFELPELQLLMEAVESSRFISESKSRKLIKKLGALASEHQSKQLENSLHNRENIKSDNENLYYIIDKITEAINSKRKIRFKYFKYDKRKKPQLYNNGEEFTVSPYKLVWGRNGYYVLGYSENFKSIGTFRVDRIYKLPVITDEEAVPLPEEVNLSEHIGTMFDMYVGKKEKVVLICDNELMNWVIDQFGKDVKTCNFDDNSFKAEVEISVSPVFFSWLFGFGGKIKIRSPEYVRQAYKDTLQKAYDMADM